MNGWQHFIPLFSIPSAKSRLSLKFFSYSSRHIKRYTSWKHEEEFERIKGRKLRTYDSWVIVIFLGLCIGKSFERKATSAQPRDVLLHCVLLLAIITAFLILLHCWNVRFFRTDWGNNNEQIANPKFAWYQPRGEEDFFVDFPSGPENIWTGPNKMIRC